MTEIVKLLEELGISTDGHLQSTAVILLAHILIELRKVNQRHEFVEDVSA